MGPFPRRIMFVVNVLTCVSAFHAPITGWMPTTAISTKRSSAVQSLSMTASSDGQANNYGHILAILTMPHSSSERIANEAILATAMRNTKSKLSVVLRCEGKTPTLASLRRDVGAVYSDLWDGAMAEGDTPEFLDAVVYPQNLPNVAPEQWVDHLPDLDCVCSHDSICGWVSHSAKGRGRKFLDIEGGGLGGLDEHVRALNADREQRGLKPVTALHADPWPVAANAGALKDNVVFVDDEALPEAPKQVHVNDEDVDISIMTSQDEKTKAESDKKNVGAQTEDVDSFILAGAQLNGQTLYHNVAVGGTFDGMHYGHRKLLTFAVSSVTPVTGKLCVGVTVDDMLRHKEYAEHIPYLEERMEDVRKFLHRLAPGMKDRIRLTPISDSFGPPGSKEKEAASFDALVLSHETLETGQTLNRHREEILGLKPLALLCTRRTEPHGMSSTALRRVRNVRNPSKKKGQMI